MIAHVKTQLSVSPHTGHAALVSYYWCIDKWIQFDIFRWPDFLLEPKKDKVIDQVIKDAAETYYLWEHGNT